VCKKDGRETARMWRIQSRRKNIVVIFDSADCPTVIGSREMSTEASKIDHAISYILCRDVISLPHPPISSLAFLDKYTANKTNLVR
jgi:hypothetical protein